MPRKPDVGFSGMTLTYSNVRSGSFLDATKCLGPSSTRVEATSSKLAAAQASTCASRSCWESRDNDSMGKFFPDGPRNEHTRNQYRHFPRMDAIAREHCKRAGVTILDAAPLYQRVDAHPGSFLLDQTGFATDCLHFCQNPTGPMSLLLELLHHTLLAVSGVGPGPGVA